MTDQARQPRGIETGGQFAASMNSEPSVDLVGDQPMSRAGQLCARLSGPDVIGSYEYRMLWQHAYDISKMAFRIGQSNEEATAAISASLDETIREAQAMKVRLAKEAASTEPSPYEDFPGTTVSNLKRLLEEIPDDEPLLYWVMDRREATSCASGNSDDCEVTPKQWVEIVAKFDEKTGDKYSPFAELSEMFDESVSEVIPQNDEAKEDS